MRSPDPTRRSHPEKTGECYCGCGGLTGGHFHKGGGVSTARGMFLHVHYGSTAALLVKHCYGPDGVNLSERHAELCPLPPGKGQQAPVRSPDTSLSPEPKKVDQCYCGCGGSTDGHFHSPGGDSTAMSKFQDLHYGSIAALLVEHGYGPNGNNLSEKHAEKCDLPCGKDPKKQCKYKQSCS